MDLGAVTHMPPKRLAIVVGLGVVGGLAWRHFHKASGGGILQSGDAPATDLSQFALAANSAGNLGSGLSQAATQPVLNPNDASRDFGSLFPLPVTKGIITGNDGIDYLI